MTIFYILTLFIYLHMKNRLTKEDVSLILKEYYFEINSHKSFVGTFNNASIFNEANGLGDSLILSSVIDYKKVNNEILESLNGDFNFFDQDRFTEDNDLNIAEIARYNWGGGHCIQRIQRALGLPIQSLPCATLPSDKKPLKGYVFVHLITNTDWKRNTPNSIDIDRSRDIENFFNSNPHLTPYYYKNDLPLPLLYLMMSKCEYFLGIDSGLMHMAAGLGLKSIVIINNTGNNIYLPRIKECDIPNSEWLYPQNVHLNTMCENPLVPVFSTENLSRAFNGEIYPYFSEDYLSLYFEKNLDYIKSLV